MAYADYEQLMTMTEELPTIANLGVGLKVFVGKLFWILTRFLGGSCHQGTCKGGPCLKAVQMSEGLESTVINFIAAQASWKAFTGTVAEESALQLLMSGKSRKELISSMVHELTGSYVPLGHIVYL